MKFERPDQVLAWLQTMPTLEELREAYPQDWEVVERDLSAIFERGRIHELKHYLEGSAPPIGNLSRPQHGKSEKKQAIEGSLTRVLRHRMATMAVKKCCLAAATGVADGKATRFNLFNGLIIQKLLFARGLVHKPVSMFWFRLFWPILWQKQLLMPLVHPKGIYCFYSQPLIEALAKLIGSRPCLEIGAGDGTLARFLKDQGMQITATDDHSWAHSVTYPDNVLKMDAREALQHYSPEVVICSWPPTNNPFERQIFKTRSVQLYVVISSRHEFAAGNWADYRQQQGFSSEEDKTLSALVLPPELETAVYLFRRKTD